MEYIKGVTFAPFAHPKYFSLENMQRSFDLMIERTHANFVIFVPGGLQDTAQSERIDFGSEYCMNDEELCRFVDYAHKKGLRVALKPTVNCRNGTWRAHINFFDEDVPCEPKWSNWFRSYTDFQLHYAQMAERMSCELFIAGCEMVQAERREAEWRKLIEDIRGVYSGPVSYNTDKYQEHRVKWWDAVDVISASGYYPIDDWENQLRRIEPVVKKFNKPFFFAECGCMSTEGSNRIPNDWSVKGALDLQGQADWYEAMFKACSACDWVRGFAVWSWSGFLRREEDSAADQGYEIYGKPAEKVVAGYYLGADF